MMAAVALLETIETVISQMCSNPETLCTCRTSFNTPVHDCFQRRLSDILSETVSLIESII